MHPDLPLEWYEGMLRELKARYPDPRARLRAARDLAPLRPLGHSPYARCSRACATPGSTRCRAAAPRSSSTASAPRLAQEGDLATVARRHARGAPPRHLDHRDHDVRQRRDARRARRAPARVREVQDEAVAGGHVGFRAFIPWSFQPGQHRACRGRGCRGRHAARRGERLGLPAHAGGLAPLPRQRATTSRRRGSPRAARSARSHSRSAQTTWAPR